MPPHGDQHRSGNPGSRRLERFLRNVTRFCSPARQTQIASAAVVARLQTHPAREGCPGSLSSTNTSLTCSWCLQLLRSLSSGPAQPAPGFSTATLPSPCSWTAQPRARSFPFSLLTTLLGANRPSHLAADLRTQPLPPAGP